MSQSDLPISFWGYALETAAFILNRVLSKAVEKTPYEIWTGKTPSLSFLKIWGCEAYVKRQISGYYFYNASENKVFIAQNGVFLEREFISKRTSGSTVQLEEIQDPQTSIIPSTEQ